MGPRHRSCDANASLPPTPGARAAAGKARPTYAPRPWLLRFSAVYRAPDAGSAAEPVTPRAPSCGRAQDRGSVSRDVAVGIGQSSGAPYLAQEALVKEAE